jgi:hypothetical protein
MTNSIARDLTDYFKTLRFFPHPHTASLPVEQLVASGGPRKVRERPDLRFDDKAAISALKALGVNRVRTGAGQEIISSSSHVYVPADVKAPCLVSFRYHNEHNGQAPAAEADCLLKPLRTMPMGLDKGYAWLELLPEVHVLSPENPQKRLFQDMLLKHCEGQQRVFYDPKVEYSKKGDNTVQQHDAGGSIWPERSNIGLIPVIKNGEVLRDPSGEIILAPVIIDAGSIMPKTNDPSGKPMMVNFVPNLRRTDLTFAEGFKTMMGYDYEEIPTQTAYAPSLSEYISQRLGRPVNVSYQEITENYRQAIADMIARGFEHTR